MFIVEYAHEEQPPYKWLARGISGRVEPAIRDACELYNSEFAAQVRVVANDRPGGKFTPLWSIIQGKEKDYV